VAQGMYNCRKRSTAIVLPNLTVSNSSQNVIANHVDGLDEVELTRDFQEPDVLPESIQCDILHEMASAKECADKLTRILNNL
jgi:hypothetical protein